MESLSGEPRTLTYPTPPRSDPKSQLFRGPGEVSVLIQIDWSSAVELSEAQVASGEDGSVRGSVNFQGVQVVAAAYGGDGTFGESALEKLLESLQLAKVNSVYTVDPTSLGDAFALVDDSQRYASSASTIPAVTLDYSSANGLVITSAVAPVSWTVELTTGARAGGDVIISDGDREVWVTPSFDGAATVTRWIEDGILINVSSPSGDIEGAMSDARRVALLAADELGSQLDAVASQRLKLPLMTTAQTSAGTVEVRGTNLDNRVVCIEGVCAPLRGLATLASIATIRPGSSSRSYRETARNPRSPRLPRWRSTKARVRARNSCQ